jgi:hypothetical protein
MSDKAKMATGIYLAYNGYVQAELTELTAPELKVEDVPATSQEDANEVTIPGRISYGKLTYKVNFINDTTQAAMKALAKAKTIGTWEVIYPARFGSLSDSYEGYISGIKPTTPQKGNPATWDVTISVNNETENTTAGNPLTTPFVTLADDAANEITLSPTAAGTTYEYTGTALNAATHLHVTATAATGTIYIDGVSTASGAASAAITFTAAECPTGQTKTIFILVTGTGKVSIPYRLTITRGVA